MQDQDLSLRYPVLELWEITNGLLEMKVGEEYEASQLLQSISDTTSIPLATIAQTVREHFIFSNNVHLDFNEKDFLEDSKKIPWHKDIVSKATCLVSNFLRVSNPSANPTAQIEDKKSQEGNTISMKDKKSLGSLFSYGTNIVCLPILDQEGHSKYGLNWEQKKRNPRVKFSIENNEALIAAQ